MHTFYGTGTALITPFKKDHSVDYDAFKNLIEFNISSGVDYLVVNGTTAESATTTKEEKAKLLEVALDVNKGRLPFMYGIGGNDTAEVLQRIGAANFKGIDSLLSVCPYYNKPSQAGVVEHYRAIAAKTPVPVLAYNVPGRTGINMSANTSIRLSEIPNIFGVKEASGDIVQALEIIKNTPDNFLVISGDDLLAVPTIAIGAVGAISVLSNPYPGKFSEMIKAALQSRFQQATETLMTFTEINPLMYEEGNPVGVKSLLEHLGICTNEVRLPLVKASDNLKNRIAEAHKKIKA
ncbi:4-hydroxy-tetrahydrodipicolinate synthase [Cytophaga aurantiaca]|uniref:4-hydroxy-tetrahydrodipicolinate synthase n=1 Tax=Cytophaga aurantiaca TaxID=29530 RepID=UPI000362221D|nr:4-hydroxy-tetrahydrodipicolinate synthase [Cytophaga aurantiaca]